MDIAVGHDAQNGVAFVARGARHVAQGLVAFEAHRKNFTRLHALEPELGANEGHGTDFAGNVDRLVGGLCHAPTIPRQPPGVGSNRMPDPKSKLETLCADRGLKMTEQRRVIARVLSDAQDHPDVEQVHKRAIAIDPNISIATVYRTVRLFEEAGILERHEFGDGRSRYEAVSESHHDHLIDVETGKVIEFADDELELLQKHIAERLGFRLVDHRMELYGVALDRER